MRILWLSNRIFEYSSEVTTGTWLKSLALMLSLNKELEIANISLAKVPKITNMNIDGITQWGVPFSKLINGLPKKMLVLDIIKIISDFKPDIIQIWGTEGYWGLLTSRYDLPGRKILNIQGVLQSIAPVYYGGMKNSEILNCIRLMDIRKPFTSMIFAKKIFSKRIKYELEILQKHNFIVTQSQWTKDQIFNINSKAVYFHTERTLRSEFLKAKPWIEYERNEDYPILFSTGIARPYKGIHVLIKALAILKGKYPGILLRIAGSFTFQKFRSSGYEIWLQKLIKKYDLQNNIEFVGSLDADNVVKNLQQAAVFINASFVESYSLALSEAMYIGTPCVVAYAGAMPELAIDNLSALFFTPGDHISCSAKIDRYISDRSLSNYLSLNSSQIAISRNNTISIVDNQVNIYKAVLKYKSDNI